MNEHTLLAIVTSLNLLHNEFIVEYLNFVERFPVIVIMQSSLIDCFESFLKEATFYSFWFCQPP